MTAWAVQFNFLPLSGATIVSPTTGYADTSIQNASVQRTRLETVYSGTDYTFTIFLNMSINFLFIYSVLNDTGNNIDYTELNDKMFSG
jgi:hypothetical protein